MLFLYLLFYYFIYILWIFDVQIKIKLLWVDFWNTNWPLSKITNSKVIKSLLCVYGGVGLVTLFIYLWQFIYFWHVYHQVWTRRNPSSLMVWNFFGLWLMTKGGITLWLRKLKIYFSSLYILENTINNSLRPLWLGHLNLRSQEVKRSPSPF